MPTYQYACTNCGHEFEQFQSFSDAALTTCPECQGTLRKVYGSVGVVFKGSGFYRTDSRGSGSSSSSATSSSSDSTKKSDSSSSSTATKSSDSSSSSATSASSSSSTTKAAPASTSK